jgi:hypothetical protein
MTTGIRLSPSGPVIANSDGGPLNAGPGMRLRLAEGQSTMGGSLAVPAVADVISAAGFGNPTAFSLTLDSPKAGLRYRAKLSLDLINVTTSVEAEVVLYLDTSIDGGTVYTNRAKCCHVVSPGSTSHATPQGARSADVYIPMTLGSALGIDDSTPPASIKLRARASMPLGVLGDVVVSSASASGGTSVTGLQGTIHMELEECF